MTRWQRYWFADGGRWSAAIVRMAIAASVLLTLRELATRSTVHIPGPPELYRPVGLWMLLGHVVPPAWLITMLWGLAIAGTCLMLVGLFSRASAAVSFVASVALVSGSFASSAAWSHQYNIVMLAQLAFLGARGGDVLSIDALIRRARGLPPIDVPRGYQWSLRLVQLAVALMFTGAFFHKMLHAQFTLRWALSDNLRHHLLVHYDLSGRPHPPLVDWILGDVWLYRTVALLNLISQAAPILAVVFVRRPWVRALAGGFFALETVALGHVVSLWNLHWLPLVALFIDWERVLGRFSPGVASPPPATPPGWSPPRAVRRFVLAFVVYDVLTAFIPTLDQRLNTYPFTAFPMFSTVRAQKPYDQHLPYAVPGDSFEAISDQPLDASAQRRIDYMHRRLYSVTDPVKYQKRLAAILADMQARYPQFGIRGVRHHLTMFEAPAYPAPAHFERKRIGVMGELDASGRFRSVLGSVSLAGVFLRPQHVDTTRATLVAYTGDVPVPHEVTAPRIGDWFLTGGIEGDPLYVVAVIDGTPWFVAGRKAWRWE